MGVHPNISASKFPRQGDLLDTFVIVCFNYDTTKQFSAKVIRDDREEPFETIFMLTDGRVVLSTECQWSH